MSDITPNRHRAPTPSAIAQACPNGRRRRPAFLLAAASIFFEADADSSDGGENKAAGRGMKDRLIGMGFLSWTAACETDVKFGTLPFVTNIPMRVFRPLRSAAIGFPDIVSETGIFAFAI
ncbi:hypothetical protein [Sphingopyxis sp.]|uniref:hypothetical protein n=1 Tax=Sphingopyxis sp. TaxID=1908224 RepID=UPI002ED79B98